MPYKTFYTGSLKLNIPVDAVTEHLIDALRDEDYPRDEHMPAGDNHWGLTEDNLKITCINELAGDFDCALEWLHYLNETVLKPRGYLFIDEESISWNGDDSEDIGIILAGNDGNLFVKYGKLEYGPPQEIEQALLGNTENDHGVIKNNDKYHLNLLANAIRDCAAKLGIIHPDAEPTGSELLMLCEDIVTQHENLQNTYKQRIEKAVEIAEDDGQYDGEHHKIWVIDQMVRTLTSDQYEKFMERNPEWDTGIAP